MIIVATDYNYFISIENLSFHPTYLTKHGPQLLMVILHRSVSCSVAQESHDFDRLDVPGRHHRSTDGLATGGVCVAPVLRAAASEPPHHHILHANHVRRHVRLPRARVAVAGPLRRAGPRPPVVPRDSRADHDVSAVGH